MLDELGVRYEARVVSAHRTPDRLYQYAKTAKSRGLKAIIAGAGGAAHLPGMTASMTVLPVLGVPVESRGAEGSRQSACRSRRCPAAFRWRPLPSAKRARRTRACSRPSLLRSKTGRSTGGWKPGARGRRGRRAVARRRPKKRRAKP